MSAEDLRAQFARGDALSPDDRRLLLEALLQERNRRAQIYPVSAAQRRLWSVCELLEETWFYNSPVMLRVGADLDPAALQRSLDDLAARQAAMRTSFRLDPDRGEPVQVIAPPSAVELEVVDLRATPAGRRATEVERHAFARFRRPFDLSHGPLSRVTLMRLTDAPQPDEDANLLLFVFHHTVFDGWSLRVLVNDLQTLYAAHAEGREPHLPPMEIQYADFATRQRTHLQGETLDRLLDYWRTQLDALPVLDLPTDRPRPLEPAFDGERATIDLPLELAESLEALSRDERASLFMTVLAGLTVVLQRYAGQDDVVVGVPVAGRGRQELETIIGCFVNSLVLRTDLSGDPTFRELVRRVRDTSLDAFEHDDIPFEQLVDEIEPARDLSRNPLFQITFELQRGGTGGTGSPPTSTIRGPAPTKTHAVRFDLEINVFRDSDRFHAQIGYRTDLFDAETIERMLGHFGATLKSAAARPDLAISRLSMLTNAERQHLLDGGDATASFPVTGPLHEIFERQAKHTPDAVAVVFEDEQLTYAELDQCANQLAHRLHRLGVGPDQLVGLALERSPALIVGILGILKAGGGYVPLDLANPPERIRFIVDDTKLRVIVTESGQLEKLPAHAAETVCLDTHRAEIDTEPTTPPPSEVTPEHVAYVIYTSGSTGTPKGVLVEHRSVARLFTATDASFGFGADDVWTLFHSCAFDFSVWEIWGALLYGGRLVVVPYWVSRSPDEFFELLDRERVTVLNQTPSAFRQLMRVDETIGRDRRLALRYVVFGGEALDLQSLRPWFDRHGDASPRLVNMYGITETTVHVTYRPLSRRDLDEAPGSVIGRPIADLRLYILDEHLELAPIGVRGEMYVGGAGVTRGYLNRPELTAERFVQDPFVDDPSARLYRTGDVGRRLANGDVEYLGRNDDQVKIRGFRIELGEIEAALETHPDVADAVVVVDGGGDGPGDKRLVAYAVPAGERTLETASLRSFLDARLPGHMVPAIFMTIAEIPLTTNGKLDPRALPAPEQSRDDLAETYVAPRSPAERGLAELWADVLELDRVGIHDNFFELGGDSIQAIQIVARAKDAGLRLTPRLMFRHQTIAALAAAMGTAATIDAEQGRVTGDVPLIPIQRWFFDRDLPDKHHFNQAMAFTVDPAVPAPILEHALGALLEHHDALRLRFARRDGAWHQTNESDAAPPPVEVVDLSSTPAASRGDAFTERADAVQTSLDLEHGPLVRIVRFVFGDDAPDRLLVVAHHLVVDGVSWGILREDLERAIDRLEREQPVVLPAKTTSFRSWARRLERHAHSDAIASELAYWRSRSWAKVDAWLPVDQDGANTVESLDRVIAALDADETRALLQDVPAAYRTQINDVLLAALGQALTPWTQQDAVLVDLEGHGREDLFEDVDLSRTVGWFTSMYPVVLTAPGLANGTADPGTVLKAVKEELRAVPHHGIGYGLLRSMHPDAAVRDELSSHPPAQVSFNYYGQFDATHGGGSRLAAAAESTGLAWCTKAERAHLLDVVGSIVGGQLRMTFAFSRNVHAAATIETIAQRFVASLRGLIEHCLAPGAGGVTPSDFPDADLDQTTLDRIVSRYGDPGVEDVYAIAPMQQGMVFHALQDATSGVYVEQVHLVFAHLETDAFTRAWHAIVMRHPVLRTALVGAEWGEPVQLVQTNVAMTVTKHDLRPMSDTAQRAHIDGYLEHDARRGFDLTVAPLIRAALMRIGDDQHECIVTFHHVILDGWSFSTLLREVFLAYALLARGEAIDLPTVRPYRDYIAWLRDRDLGATETFWRRRLEGFDAPTTVGIDQGSARAGAIESYDERQIMLSIETTQRLRALASERQVTLNTLVLGAWSLLLSRYSGDDDVVFGTTVSGRPHDLDGVESIVGLFINTLPTRVRFPKDAQLGTWLQTLQAEQAEERSHDFAPLGTIQKWCDCEPGKPLFETLFVFENYPVDTSTLQGRGAGLQVRTRPRIARTSIPLMAVVSPGRELRIRLTFDRSRFEEDAIERLAAHLHRLIEGLVADPQSLVSDRPMLGAEERHELVLAHNATTTTYPRNACIHELFAAEAAAHPDTIAVSLGDETLTYGELNRRANQLAHHLIARGVGPETMVGICVERSLEMVVGILGILKAGGAYVPLATDYPVKRLAVMLEDTRAPVVLIQGHLRETLPVTDALADVEIIELDGDWATIAKNPLNDPPNRATADGLAYVMYTSGSTGRPKGTAVVHRGVVRLVRETNYMSFGPDEVFLQLAPISFDASTLELWGALLNGGRVVVFPPGRPSLADLAAAIRDGGVTSLWLTAALFHEMVDAELESLCGVRQLLSGGDVLSVLHVKRVLAALPPGGRLINGYGPTENTTFTCCHMMTRGDAIGATVPIGRPISNTRVYVVDRHLQPVPTGVYGELLIGGDGLSRAYWNEAALTADRFVPDPFGPPGGRLYRTGDLVRWCADGTIEFRRRLDHQVKIRGFRIELGEVSSAIRAHPDVADAVVVVGESEPGAKRLIAYVVPGNGSAPEPSVLRSFLDARLPAHMVPAVFMTIERIPLTANGKIDNRALPVPDQTRGDLSETFAPPRNRTEDKLCELWATVLGLERVGINDNFFELGGDSILSIQIVARAKEEGIRLTPNLMFEHRTIAAIAAAIADRPEIVAEQGAVEGDVPLSPIQDWFFERELLDAHHVNQAMLFAVEDRYEPSILEQAVGVLLEHHDALRLRFERRADGWHQRLDALRNTAPFSFVDLSELAIEQRASALTARATELQTSLDLAHGPLMRIAQFRMGEDEPDRLLVIIHHLAVDGVSWRILREDLQRTCESLATGKQLRLPAKTTSFRRWAQRLEARAQFDEASEERDYWLELPWDRVRAVPRDGDAVEANTVDTAERLTVSLNEAETRQLLQEVPRAYKTQINDILLTAVAQTLAPWIDNSTVLIDLEGHGREDLFPDLDVSRTVGWFTSIFPVILDAPDPSNPAASLMSVKEQLRSIPNRGIGFGLLRYLSAAPDLREQFQRLPAAEISFNYLGRLDQMYDARSTFGPARESPGPMSSPLGRRVHLIDITGSVLGGRLQMNWVYSRCVHDKATVQDLSERFIRTLRDLITHCLSPDSGAITASDVAEFGWGQSQLDRIAAAMAKDGKRRR